MSLKYDLYIDFSACQYVLLISFTCSSKFPAKITQWFCAKHFARVKWNVSSRIKNYFHKNNSFFHSIVVKSPEFINFTLYTQSMIRQWKFNERKRYFCNILLLSHTFKFKTYRIWEFHSNNIQNVLLFIRDLSLQSAYDFKPKI